MVNHKHWAHHTRGEISFSSLISKPWSKPHTCKKSKSESLVFGWESRWLSCWWQPLGVLSGFPLLCDKIYEYGEGWRERNPHRLSLAYLDFCSQHSLAACRTQVGDLDKNVAYCCNRYCCCQLTYGRSGRMSNGREGEREENHQNRRLDGTAFKAPRADDSVSFWHIHDVPTVVLCAVRSAGTAT